MYISVNCKKRTNILKQDPSKYFTLAQKIEKNKFELEKISSLFKTRKKIQFIKVDISECLKSSTDKYEVGRVPMYIITFFLFQNNPILQSYQVSL